MQKVTKRIFNIELTNNCNFCCKFCPQSIYRDSSVSGNSFNRSKGFMTEKVYDFILNNLDKHAKSVIFGFFGEQLLHPFFTKFIDKIPTVRSYTTCLNTNWSLITRDHFNTLNKFNIVKISLDSIKPDTYENLCHGGSVLELDGNISRYRCETIVEKIKEWMSLPQRPSTEIIFVTSSVNRDEIKEFVRFWKPYLGVSDIIAIKSVISYGGIVKDSYMTKNNCRLHNGGKVTISWDGNISPCNLDVNMELKTVNIAEIDDFRDIFSSKEWNSKLIEIKDKKIYAIIVLMGTIETLEKSIGRNSEKIRDWTGKSKNR